jgi:hypothetical protein
MSLFKKVHLDYDFSHILSADYQQHTGSCIQHQRRELADIHQKVGSLPETYVLANTTIHQLWWNRDQLDYDDLGKQLDMEVVSISSIMQPPGNCIPYHRDMFNKIKLEHPDRTDLKVRANIFLEDGDLGHLMQFTLNDVHETFSNWKINTGYLFDSDILHLSANAGMKPKYTLQISGFYLGQEQ